MGLYTVNNNKTVQALDINQMITILQRPSGSQEKGKYILSMPGYAANATCSTYMPSLSRGSSPVSVTLDAADQANSGFTASPAHTNILTASGFQIYDLASGGPQTNPMIGGNYTIQY